MGRPHSRNHLTFGSLWLREWFCFGVHVQGVSGAEPEHPGEQRSPRQDALPHGHIPEILNLRNGLCNIVHRSARVREINYLITMGGWRDKRSHSWNSNCVTRVNWTEKAETHSESEKKRECAVIYLLWSLGLFSKNQITKYTPEYQVKGRTGGISSGDPIA
jgi:hypothetical protein